MKKLKQAIILFVLVISIVFIANHQVLAINNEVKVDDFIKKVEYSEEFKNWLKLPEAERVNTIQPKMYDELNTPFVVNNPMYQLNLLAASMNARYSLKDTIASNVAIRNQQDTNMCWAFAGLSSLETNLALNNYYSGENTSKVYDFSERHANYATARVFLNDEINEYGFNRAPATGGQWYLIENYLTNGQGAVDESAMPFMNSNNIISISEIENKKVETQVYDTIYFDNYNALYGNDRTEAMNKIKQHIQEHGSVFASIHGDSFDSISYSCYNNETGAKYCDDAETHVVDHAVSIIGWDDTYSIDNFSEYLKPSSPGAWIVRNSWGENLEYDLILFKQELFDLYTEQCLQRGWNSAFEIPNSFIESVGYTVTDDKVLIPIGDEGYMYVSYDDCNVGQTLYGIVKATDEVNYDYLYQYNELYPAVEITLTSPSTYLCSVFEKQSTNKEFLTEVALTAPETYTCKVYINPNGSGKRKSDLQLVPLKSGDSVTIDKGYHTLEFANPVEIKSNEFAVVVEITGTRPQVDILLEGKINEIDTFDYVKVESGKCFVASEANFETCIWFDTGTLGDMSDSLTNGDISLKAFTKLEVEDKTVNRIEVVTPPNKTTYVEGESFEKGGMTIRVVYNDGTTSMLDDSDYSITNGTNLQYGRNSVTITYMDKSVDQPITVVKKEVPAEEKPEPKPEEQKPKEEAVTSDFTNAKFTLTMSKVYTYDDSSKNYYVLDAEITGITRNLKNDSYEYYYYLSNNANASKITNWIKIDEKQTSSNKITFTIDSRKTAVLENELSDSKTMYIYVREVVVKGANQGVAFSRAIKYEKTSGDTKTYYNDVEVQNNKQGAVQGNSEQYTSGEYTDKQVTKVEETPSKLPYTGSNLLLIGIILIIIVGIVLFVRYEILNQYVK